MLPGNAKRLPVPIRFLIRLVVNAAPTAQNGPSKTPAITFMECWKGKHLVGPTGMETKERATPTPARIPAASAFLKIIFFNVSFLFILYTSINVTLHFTVWLIVLAKLQGTGAGLGRPAYSIRERVIMKVIFSRLPFP
jgi:hypothetical protein